MIITRQFYVGIICINTQSFLFLLQAVLMEVGSIVVISVEAGLFNDGLFEIEVLVTGTLFVLSMMLII